MIGFGRDLTKQKRIYQTDEDGVVTVCEVNNINPYLVASDSIIVQAISGQTHDKWLMLKGNQPTDGGHLCLSVSERNALSEESPKVASYVRRYVGWQELIRGEQRYCIWVNDYEKKEAEQLPTLAKRFERVLRSTPLSTQDRQDERVVVAWKTSSYTSVASTYHVLER